MEYIDNGIIKLPILGLGTFTMHGEQLRSVVNEAVRLGYKLFDTATKYENEADLGVVLNRGIDHIIQSKVHATQLLGNMRFLRLNKKSIKKSILLSRDRLNTIPDIYLLHSPFNGYENHLIDLYSIRERGELKAMGICNITLTELRELINKTGIKPDIIQVEIHPFFNNRELVDYCNDKGIIVEARSPLAHGDALQEWQSNKVLQSISSNYGISIPQVILRWIIQQNVSVIVRTINSQHLKENIDIFNFSLTDKEMSFISSLNKNLSYGYISLH